MGYRRRAAATVGGYVSLAVLSMVGCGSGPPAEDQVLATVGEFAITVGDLQTYEAGLLAAYRSTAGGAAAHREHLQGLIDRQIMLNEARRQGYDARDQVRANLDSLVNRKLVEGVLASYVASQVHVTEEELRQAYQEHEIGWFIWPAHILLETEQEALDLIRRLQGGQDFATLAREYSLADDADRGGELREWFNAGAAVPALVEGTFHLEPGQVSAPIRTIDGWEVVKVIDKKRIPFEQARAEIVVEARRRKYAARRVEVLDSLMAAFDLCILPGRSGQLLTALRTGDVPGDPMAAAITWQGGSMRMARVAELLARTKRGQQPTDSTEVTARLLHWILPDTVLVLEARRQQFEQADRIVAWRQEKQQALMIGALHADAVKAAAQVKVSQQDLRQSYEQDQERYSLPGEYHLTEVYVETRQRAEQIMTAVREGADLTALAAEQTRRRLAEDGDLHMGHDGDGHLLIDPMRSSPYHKIFSESATHKVGVVQGPFVVESGYAVVRLDEPIEPYVLPFEQVRRRVLYRLRKTNANRRFETWIDSLRQARIGDVTVHEELIEALPSP